MDAVPRISVERLLREESTNSIGAIKTSRDLHRTGGFIMTAFNAVALSLGYLLSRADKRFLLTVRASPIGLVRTVGSASACLRVSPQPPQLDLGRTKP
jgi:hypothetical protein